MEPSLPPISPPSRRRRLRRFATNLALCAAAGAVTVVLAEFAVRPFFPQWAPRDADRNFWAYDPILGWAHQPNQRGTFRHPDFAVTVAINSDGLRDQEYPLERQPGKKRMLVLGDSFAWGFGVEREQIFCERIERRHRDREIINAAVSGYSTDQELLYFVRQGMRYKPDVVLLLMHPNDLWDNSRSETSFHNKPAFAVFEGRPVLIRSTVPKPKRRQRLERFLTDNTYLLGRAYVVLLGTARRPNASVTAAGSEAITIALLAELRRACQSIRAKLIIVSVPGMPSDFQAALALFGAPYLPLDSAFAATHAATSFPHDDHWNAKGHAVAADAIEKFLADRGVF